MATMTIRNFDDALKARLRIRAAEHGKSMEEEARDILRAALSSVAPNGDDLGEAIAKRFEAVGGVELSHAPREPIRNGVDFEA